MIKLYRAVKVDDVGRVIGQQMLRSGTSIGANVEEAQAAQSRADFIHKMSIALKEVRETFYWLRLIQDAEIIPNTRLNDLMAETQQISRILYTIIKTAKSNNN